jgi:hypothetical protein
MGNSRAQHISGGLALFGGRHGQGATGQLTQRVIAATQHLAFDFACSTFAVSGGHLAAADALRGAMTGHAAGGPAQLGEFCRKRCPGERLASEEDTVTYARQNTPPDRNW